MHGLMMDVPLLIIDLIRHADRHHGDTEIVSQDRSRTARIHRYTYREAHARARQLAKALARAGRARRATASARSPGTATAISRSTTPSPASGAVMHTINPRLFPEQIVYIVNHAEDRLLFFDLTFAPLVEKLAPRCKGGEGLGRDDRPRAHAARSTSRTCCATRSWSRRRTTASSGRRFDERTASSLCYTSGTTGNPKGVLYCAPLHGAARLRARRCPMRSTSRRAT